MPRRTRTVASLLAVAAALVAAPARPRAEGFSTTNVQLLQGFSFDDAKLGYDTRNGLMTTFTLNQFTVWEYGDSFFFADLQTGDFRNDNPPLGHSPGANLYAEWHPRLFLDRVFGAKGDLLGVFRHVALAAELNQGFGFYAWLAGLGVDLALPAPHALGVNIYYRYDRFDRHVWQVSPFWLVPFRAGPVPFLFTGFVDVAGTKDAAGNAAVDVMAQPELLVDVLAPFGLAGNRLYAGVEWYVHRYPDGVYGPARTVSAPQAMVQWVLF